MSGCPYSNDQLSKFFFTETEKIDTQHSLFYSFPACSQTFCLTIIKNRFSSGIFPSTILLLDVETFEMPWQEHRVKHLPLRKTETLAATIVTVYVLGKTGDEQFSFIVDVDL